MSDFSLKYANWKSASIMAAVTAALFIVVPLIIISLFTTALNSITPNGTDLSPLISTIKSLSPIFIEVGAVITLLAFMMWLYPKGSHSRLMFAIPRYAAVGALEWMLLLNGGLESAISKIGPDIPLYQIVYLLWILVGYSIIVEIAIYFDSRRDWIYRRDQPKDVVLPPLQPEHPEEASKHRIYHDFRARYGKYNLGIKLSRRSVERYMIVPLIAFIIIDGTLNYISSAGIGDLQTTLASTKLYLVLIGVAIASVAFFKGFYPKGSVSRMTFGILVAATEALWLWIVTLQGHISISMVVQSNPISLSLNYQPIILLLMAVAGLWGIYSIVEMFSYRKDWIEGGFVPVDDALIKAKKREEKERRKADRQAQKNSDEAKKKSDKENKRAQKIAAKKTENTKGKTL